MSHNSWPILEQGGQDTHTHIFTKVLMGFAWDTHTYKDQKSQWHIYGGLINVSKVAIGGKEYWYCKKILVLA